MGKSVLIIGGGIIGLSTAYYLNKSGHEVTIIDKSNIRSGASFVNAGYLTPSHIIPLAAPGVLLQGLKWMVDSSSPLYIKPRWDLDFFKWSWYFHRSSTRTKVEKAIPIIKDINLLSKQLFQEIKTSGDLGNFQLEHTGLLMLYQTMAAYEHEVAVVQKAKELGLAVSELDIDGLQKIQPNVAIAAKGAIYYECDGHTTPTEFMPKMVHHLSKNGVIFKTDEIVRDLKLVGNKVKEVQTSKNAYQPDEIVMAAGSWTGILAKKLGIKLPLQAGKGYSLNVARETGITLPAILMEAKMAVTPMRGFTRFAGTMEFSGINQAVRKERVAAIVNGARRFYPDLEIKEAERSAAQIGLRPVSPDGLPYIGRSKDISNLLMATGHAMMGWSLGPATGKLVQQLIDDRPLELNISPFRPDRKFH